MVGVPHARRGDEGAARLPVDPDRVDDVAALVEAGAQQGVAAAGWRVEDQVQGHRLVPVRALHLAVGQQPEHGPQHVGDGQGLLLVGVGQQHADPALLVGAGARRDVLELGHGVGAAELGGPEPGPGRVGAQVAQQRLVVHPVHGGVGVGVEGDRVPAGSVKKSPLAHSTR